MGKTLDLSQASEYDLICERGRILSTYISCEYDDTISGTTVFDFSTYTSATLVVKNTAGTIVLSFSTEDGGIELLTNGVFKLYKTAEQMNAVRAGIYKYDMYINSPLYPKRAFLKGNITFNQNIAN